MPYLSDAPSFNVLIYQACIASVRRALWAIALVFSLAAGAAEKPLESVRLQLQWKHQFEFAGFYAAKEKGFYEEAGLDVELLEFDGQDPAERVLANEVEYAIGYSSVLLNYLDGQPLVLLANFLKQSPIAIVAQPEIKSVSDLSGKRVMGIANSIEDITLQSIFSRFDLSLDSVINVPPAFSTEPFINGEVDAMVVFTSNELFDIEQANKPYKLFDPSLYGAEYYDVNLITSQQRLRKSPEQVQRFRDASIRGWIYALENQSEIIELIQKKYNTQGKSYEALRFEALEIKRNMMTQVSPVGSVDPQRLYQIASDLMELGIITENRSLDFSDFVFSEPEPSLNLSSVHRAYLRSKNTITFCADPGWMPFESFKDGKHIGMAADFVKLFADKLTTPFQLIETRSWDESLEKAYSRECDILVLAMRTPERSVHMDFTRPYLSYPLVIATRTDTVFIADITDVLDRRMGIVKGYAFAELLKREYPDIQLVEVESVNEGLRRVDKGELFGFVGSLATLAYVIQDQYIGELKIAGKFEEEWELGVAVRNDEPMLTDILDQVVASITADEQREIENRWISVVYEQGIDYTLLAQAASVMSLIFGLFAFHQVRLRRANRQIQNQNELLQVLSIKDRLTNLNNRLRMEELVDEAVDRFERYGHSFSVLLIDVDLFKRVNDEKGHHVGDLVLQELSMLMDQNIRRSDSLGRWGGEEFLVLCPGAEAQDAALLAEKLVLAVRENRFSSEQKQTISIGVAQIQQGHNLTKLLIDADEALYKAKAWGRDQVVVHDPTKNK